MWTGRTQAIALSSTGVYPDHRCVLGLMQDVEQTPVIVCNLSLSLPGLLVKVASDKQHGKSGCRERRGKLESIHRLDNAV